MQNPICISTGCLHALCHEDRNKMIEELRKFSPVGIELSFAYPEYLLDFNITKKNLDYLRSLKFTSIHPPWIDMSYGQGKIDREIFDKISYLYKQIKANHVVFHKEGIADYDFVLGHDFVASLENEDWRVSEHKVADIKQVLDHHQGFKFTFDFAHALTVSAADIAEYLNYFKDKLIEIHISFFNKETEEHDFLHKYDNQEIRRLLRSLKKVAAPLVLEATVSNQQELQLINREMAYLKEI